MEGFDWRKGWVKDEERRVKYVGRHAGAGRDGGTKRDETRRDETNVTKVTERGVVWCGVAYLSLEQASVLLGAPHMRSEGIVQSFR